VRRLAVIGCLAVAAVAAGCGASAAPPPSPQADPAPPAPPAAAPAPARSEPFALVPDAAGDVVALTLAPGGSATAGLRLANGGDRERTFALAVDRGWIAVPATVTVPARQSVAVAAAVAAPADAPSGTDVARVAARADERGGGALSVEYAASVAVRLTVAP
jgi:hypothetical protein